MKVLFVGDDARDVAPLLAELERGGYCVSPARVETLEGLEAALDGRWDLILSGRTTPALDGTRVLALVEARASDVPYIVMSGTLDEQLATSMHELEGAQRRAALQRGSALDPPRRARIAIVDDDQLVLRALQRVLGSQHEVWTTTSPQDLLERVRAGFEFDILLCDLLISSFSGMELHAVLERESPEHARRITFMSGGLFTPGARHFLETTARPCIDKPFATSTLRDLVAQQLRNNDVRTMG